MKSEPIPSEWKELYKAAAEFLVTKQEAVDLFSPIADKIEIRLRKVDRLPALDEARRSMEEHFLQKEDRPQFAGQIGADVGHKDPVAFGAKTGRNEPCPCGSGKKYKKCCGITH